MGMKGTVDRTVARVLAPVPEVLRWWARRSARARSEGEVPWTPFAKRFAESRVAVVTTGGFHRPGEPGFDCDRGDPSFREVPGDFPLGDLRISHTHYDTRDARRDPNILLPLDRLREVVEEEGLGSLAPTHFSLMGYIPQVETLVGETAPAIAKRMGREEVDMALLTPA